MMCRTSINLQLCGKSEPDMHSLTRSSKCRAQRCIHIVYIAAWIERPNQGLAVAVSDPAMVVAELLKWKSPAAFILLMVMLGQSPSIAQPPALQNDFVEVFSGDAAVTLACWNRGLVGSCHDVRYTSLMDMSSTHGFLLLTCNILILAKWWNHRTT